MTAVPTIEETLEKSARTIAAEGKVDTEMAAFTEAVDKARSVRRRDLSSASKKFQRVEAAIAKAESLGGSVEHVKPEYSRLSERLRELWAVYQVRHKARS